VRRFGDPLAVGPAKLWPERLGIEQRKSTQENEQHAETAQARKQAELHEPKLVTPARVVNPKKSSLAATRFNSATDRNSYCDAANW